MSRRNAAGYNECVPSGGMLPCSAWRCYQHRYRRAVISSGSIRAGQGRDALELQNPKGALLPPIIICSDFHSPPASSCKAENVPCPLEELHFPMWCAPTRSHALFRVFWGLVCFTASKGVFLHVALYAPQCSLFYYY